VKGRSLPLLTLLIVGMFGLPSRSLAQDFGVLESAETIDPGNFKLLVTPLFVFGKGGEEDQNRIVLGAGYGATRNLDIEGKVAFGDTTIVGGNAEYWLIKRQPLDLSIIGGLHYLNNDGPFDVWGVDLTLLGSKHVARKLEVYGGLDFDFNRFTKNVPDRSVTQAHLVPGIEYAISGALDFVAEVGVALTDRSRHYAGFGLAFYVR
jgi:hypothetical protein